MAAPISARQSCYRATFQLGQCKDHVNDPVVPIIVHCDEQYYHDISRNAYLNADKSKLLVVYNDGDDWMEFDCAITVNEYRHYVMKGAPINIRYYDRGISYLVFEDCSQGPGISTMMINLRKLLEVDHPELFQQIMAVLPEGNHIWQC